MEIIKNLSKTNIGKPFVVACLILLILVTIIYKEYDWIKISLTFVLLGSEIYGGYILLLRQNYEERKRNLYSALGIFIILIIIMSIIIYIR